MALDKLPSNLYAGNAVAFNALPYVQYAQKLRQEKDAKDEALNKYYGNLPNTANEKGTRDIDIPVIHKAVADAQQYWLQNSDAIKKGNTPENFNFQKLIRGAQGTVVASQNEQAAALKRASMRGNPANDWMFGDPDYITKEQSAALPINDPNFQPFDITALKPKPYDPKNDFEGFTGANALKPVPDQNVPVKYEDIPGDKFNRIPITTNKLSPEDVNKVLTAGAAKLHGVQGHAFGEYLKTLDPETVKTMDDNFSKATGKPVTSNEDVAAAYLYSRVAKNLGETRGKPEANKQAMMDQQLVNRKEMAAIQDRYTRGHILLQNNLKDVGANVNDAYSQIENTVTADINSGKNPPEKTATMMNKLGALANPILVTANSIYKTDAEDANGNWKAGKPLDVTNTFLHKDNGTTYLYKAADDGTLVADERHKIMPISQTGINLKAPQAGAKEKRAIVATGNTTSAQNSVPTHTRADYKAAGWSDKQIETAAKAGKIKVN